MTGVNKITCKHCVHSYKHENSRKWYCSKQKGHRTLHGHKKIKTTDASCSDMYEHCNIYNKVKCNHCDEYVDSGLQNWINHALNECNHKNGYPILLRDLGNEYPNEKSNRMERYGIFSCQFMGCENTYRAIISSVLLLRSRSCGCQVNYLIGKVNRTHGLGWTRLYRIWHGMVRRCDDEKTAYYHLYGGNGVRVCEEWRNDFMAFREWSLNNGYADNLSLNRIRGSKIYSPDTCNYVDCSHQSQDTKLIKSNNKSGYRGVSWSKNRQKWEARIGLYHKHYFLGYFDDPREGAIAFNNWVVEHNTHHTLNIIE